MPRSPIPDLVERFHQLEPVEQKCFLELVDPQVEEVEVEQPKPVSKKAAKKVAKGGCVSCDWMKASVVHTDPSHPNHHKYEPKRGKSKRAGALSETIAKGLKDRREESVTISPLDNPNACEYRFDGGKICGSDKDSGIHDKAMGYSGYHEFVGKSDASSAASQSSTNGAGSGSTRNSETEREDASSAHHVASGD